jgi:hypothetical protein
MNLLLFFALASTVHSTEAAKVSKPVSEIKTLASFTGPAGWIDGEDEVLGDPLVRFSSGPYTIRASLFGGKQSRHETPADFLTDFEAFGEGNQPPDKLGFARIDGKRYQAYGRTYQVSVGDPHVRGLEPRETIDDEFVVVPIPGSKRFFVLTLKTSKSLAYMPDKRGTAAWAAFLKSFKLKK